ncbi:MAG: Fur family transcriptional regulator [Gemmataceae bacterium]
MTLPAVSVSQSPEEKFREYLSSRGRPQRFTDQQREMVRYIFSQHNHFDADQLIDAMKKAGLEVSRATVYRTLGKLVDAGLLRKLEMGTRSCYEHDYGYPQHEHLHCTKCGKMIEFQSEALVATLKQVCQENRFQSSGHTLIIRGVCGECSRSRAAKRVLDLI